MQVYYKEDSKFSHSLSAVVVVLSQLYGWIACTCVTLQQRVQQRVVQQSFMQFVVVLCHHNIMVVLFKSLQQR